jgi:Trk K+ transport system NAD-binding subunit
VPKELKNIKIQDSHLTDQYSINIVVIKRKDEYMFANKDTIIKKGDTITLFGPYKNIKLLFNTGDEKEKSE